MSTSLVLPHAGKVITGVVVQHDDPATSKHVAPDVLRDRIHLYDDAVGREAGIVSLYTDHGTDFRFPVELCSEIRQLGKIPCLFLWPDEKIDAAGNWLGIPTDNHSLEAIIDGKADGYFLALAAQVRDFGSPVILGFDEPSGFAWGHASQGGGEVDSLDGMLWPRGASRFVRAYRQIYSLVSAVAPNVTWFLRLVPGWDDANWWKRSKFWFPGKDWVTWLGMNVPTYVVQHDGTVLWPTWEPPTDALNLALAEVNSIEGAETLPLSIGFNASEDVNQPFAKANWLTQFFRVIEQAPPPRLWDYGLWVDCWADATYSRGSDVWNFPASASAMKSCLAQPLFSSQPGIYAW